MSNRIIVSNGQTSGLITGKIYTADPIMSNGGMVEVQSGGTLNTNGAVFTNNKVTSNSGSKKGRGGAIYNDGTTNVSGGSFNSNQGQNGGAIFNSGAMTISGATFSGNSAGNLGGAVYNSCGTLNVIGATFSGNNVQNNGAGIYVSSGTVNVSGASFIGNNTPKYGGAIVLNRGTVNVSGGSFVSNSAQNAAAIYSYSGTVKVIGATFFGNNVKSSGGAIITRDMLYVSGGSFVGNSAGSFGGAIVNSCGTANVSGATFSGNAANSGGGAIYNTSSGTVNVSGANFTSNQGKNGGALFNVSGGTVNVSGGSFVGNNVTNVGGAICNIGGTANVTGATFSGNSATYGGAIYNTGSGTVNVFDATFSANSAGNRGGAIFNVSGGTVNVFDATFVGNSTLNLGGAIFNSQGTVYVSGGSFAGNMANYAAAINNSAGRLTVIGATFSGNAAQTAYGGAIRSFNGTDQVIDGTFTGNSATSGGAIHTRLGKLDVSGGSFSGNVASQGGAIYNASGCTATFSGATFSGNSASHMGGAIYNYSGTATISGATFAGNSAGIGGAIENDGGTMVIFNATFAGNSASFGGAIDNFSGTVVNLAGVTFSGNVASLGGAILNEKDATMNLLGAVTLATANDGVDNASGAVINWDLTNAAPGAAVVLNGYQNLSNKGDLTITVNAAQTKGDYTIATGSFDSIADKQNFTLKTTDDAGKTITVGGEAVEYNGLAYTLAVNDNALVLNVSDLKSITYTVGGDGEYTYDGKDHTITVSVTDPSSGAKVYYSIDGKENWIEGSSFSAKNYGIIDVNFKIEASGYVTTITEAYTLDIQQKELTVVGTMVDGKTYDGNANATIGTLGTLTGVIDGEQVALDTATATFDDKNAGNGKDVTIHYTIAGNDVKNYKISDGTTIADIEKRDVTLTSADDSKVYDGTPLTNDTVTVSGSGFVEGEGATYTVTGTQTEIGSSANTFTYTLNDGTLENNYTIETVEGTLTVISPIEYTLSESVTTTYDGNEHGITVTVTNPPTGASVYYSLDGGANWTLTATSSYMLTDATDGAVSVCFKIEAEGYGSMTTEERTITITPKRLSVSGTTVDDKTYDCTRDAVVHEGTLSGIVEGDDVTLAAEGEFNSANAGKRTVAVSYTLEGDDAHNYETVVAETISATITKRSVTLESASDSKTYDGTPLTNDAITVSGEGFADGEGATYDVTGSQTEVGSSANTFTYTLYDNTRAGNYDVTKIEGTLTVNPTAKVSNYNNTAKSDMIQFVNNLVYVTYDTASGYVQTPAINDVTGWNVVETRRDLTGDGLADVQITSDDGAGNTWVAALRNDFDGEIKLNYQFIGAYDNKLWSYLGSADVNGDGKSEVLMVQTDAGADPAGHRNVAAWVTDSEGKWIDNEWVGALDPAWEIAGTADLDGNGTDNVILRRADGMIGYWSEAGSNEIIEVWNAGESRMLTSGEFSGDGADDLLFDNAAGDFYTWTNVASGVFAERIGNVNDLGEGWSFAGAGDYNGDGKDEILWCNSSISKMAYSEANKENFANLVAIA